MNEIFETLQSWWNNNVAFANTAGVTSTLIVLAYAFVGTKLKKKNNTISIDVNQSTKEVNDLKNEVKGLKNELLVAAESINKLTDLVFTFANSTKIDDGPKRELAKIYANVKSDSKPIVEKAKEVIETVVEEVKDVVEKESIIDKLRKEANI